ncbi:MAG: hypothetical protein [Chaetfec virus UA24_144]|nr:MAG: hypothetical protein [Chaetfec virus UA24_144]
MPLFSIKKFFKAIFLPFIKVFLRQKSVTSVTATSLKGGR